MKKIIVTSLILILFVTGGVYLLFQDNTGYKGQIFNVKPIAESSKTVLKPDLTGTILIDSIDQSSGDINVKVKIENQGPGKILAETPYEYSILINNFEVIKNQDNYSSMESGDSFEFKYPISKDIYKFQDNGVITLLVDSGNSITEVSENNNKVEIKY